MSAKETGFSADTPSNAHGGVPEKTQRSNEKEEYIADGHEHGSSQHDHRPAAGGGGEWEYGMWVCCSDCDSCLEANCCWGCQLSRQYNYIHHGSQEIHWNKCLALHFLGFLTCGVYPVVVGMSVREAVRDRYSIAGSSCNDCLQVSCLSQCELQQSLLQMTHRGDFPGASCYDVEKNTTAPNAQMV